MAEEPAKQLAADRVEDGKMIIGDPSAGTPPVETPIEAPTETPTVETPTETPVEHTGFQKKSDMAAEPAAPPEWLESFNKEVGGEYGDINAIKQRLAAEPKTINADFKDDYIKNAADYYDKHGTLKPYLDAFSVNFKDMSPENLMRHKLQAEYPNMSPSGIEKLYQRDVVAKYGLDPEENDEDAVKFGNELLSSDSEKLRAEFIEKQSAFNPPPKEDVQAKMDQQMQEWRDSVTQHPATQEFVKDGLININVDGEDYSYQVQDASEMAEMAVDNRNFWKLFDDGQGGTDFSKFYEVAAFAKNPEQYRNALIGLGKSSGVTSVKSVVKNGESPSIKTQNPDGYTDWSEGFLNAALAQKKN